MEYIDLKYWKLLGIYSLILGGISGLISTITIFMPFFSLFFLPFLGCLAPLIILVFKDGFETKENKTYAILGAFSGGCISVSYLIVFVIIAYIVHFIFKSYYFGAIVQYLNLYLLIMFMTMIALIYIITNAVTALLFGLSYNYYKEIKNGKND